MNAAVLDVGPVARPHLRDGGRTPARVFALLLCATALAGCGVVGKAKRLVGLGPDTADLKTLAVSADAGANLGNATRLDVVVIYTDRAVAALPKTGPEWFRQRDALQAGFPRELALVPLEVPSPSPEFVVALPRDTRSRGLEVRVFADYAAQAGWPAISLTPFKRVALRLGAESIVVEETP